MAGRRNNVVAGADAAEKESLTTSTKPANNTSRRRGSRGTTSNNNNNLVFSPRLIFSQIVAMQCFHYLILGFMVQMNHFIFSTSITIDRIFSDAFLNLWSWHGWIDISAILLSYLFGSILLALIVEKSKKCLDFSVTLFLIHLFSCIWYAGLPHKMDWWIVHILGTIVMILLGEYLCSLKELSDIPLLEL